MSSDRSRPCSPEEVVGVEELEEVEEVEVEVWATQRR